ncbi:MAG: cytochrome P460 family protein [Bacteroidetes bacterium]|nr:cytochrome P460 family protein [Bacteroidota bacterium]NCQ11779.1 cytochrome P460 family protein [Bacteroidota bacterium]
MKYEKLKIVALLFLSSITLQYCSDAENDSNEFIADTNTFSSFMNFSLEASNQGPDPALGMAHAGNDSTVTRKVYVKDGQDIVNGKYPVGTVIVKHSMNTDLSVNEITAMVKRGNDFNTEVGDWEWFMLNPADNTILGRGGKDMMNGMCNACHSANASKDYVFSK